MKNKFKLLIVSYAILASSIIQLQAQCQAPSSIDATYCPGQPATIDVVDNATDVRYAWYDSPIDNIPSYGLDGEGREFISSGTQNASASFYYSRETTTTIGPAFRAPSGGVEIENDGVNSYAMPFDTDIDLEVNSYTVIVKMEDPSETYGFATRWIDGNTTDTTYADWFTGQPSDFTSLGNDLYQVEVPVVFAGDGLQIDKGDGHVLEFISADDVGYSAVEAFYWFGAGEFTGNNYGGGNVEMPNPEYEVSTGTDQSPLLMDWNVVLKCDWVEVTTVQSNACCTPVEDDFTITASPTSTPIASDFPVTLTASGPNIDANMYYYWYDVAGTLLDDGQGMSSFNVNDIGTYTVRIVNDPADISAVACYGNKSTLLGIRNIFAPDDMTICIGDPLTLNGTGAEGNYSWSSNDPVADAAIETPDAQETNVYLKQSGEYTFTVEGDVKLGNIAYDGKFENFDDAINFDQSLTGLSFETTYGIAGPTDGSAPIGSYITGNGQFRVDDELKAWSEYSDFCTNNPDYWNKTAPSGDVVSRGNIFYADAHTGKPETPGTEAFALNNYLWQQSNQPVEPNQDYEFTMDVSEWNSSTSPEMMLLVNGQALDLWVDGVNQGKTYIPPGGATDGCQWKTVIGRWNSGSNTTATITVAEVSNQLTGYEFAMDDITFSTGIGKQTDDVVVTVDDCRELEARDDSTICIGDEFPLYLNVNNGFVTEWVDQNNNVVSTSETDIVYTTANNLYTVTAKFPVRTFIKNGSFSDEDIDFETDLSTTNNAQLNSGEYFIGTDEQLHSSMSDQPDHTTGTGDMYVMRFGSGDEIIRKTIPVENGEAYGFSAWLKNLHTDIYNGSFTNSLDYRFELSVDGVLIEEFTLGQVTTWEKFTSNWVSTSTGNVEVVLTAFAANGNNTGLAIDDITLAQLDLPMTDNVTVSTNNCFQLEAMADDVVCVGEPITLSTVLNDGFIKEWTNSDGDVVSTEPEASVFPTQNETYTVLAEFPVIQLIKNGNFEKNQGLDFTTDLSLLDPNQNYQPGNYIVGTGNDPKVVASNNFIQGEGDHTIGNLTGKMFLGMFDQSAGNVLIEKDITTVSGEDYGFSAWLKYMYSGTNGKAYPIELYVDNVLVKEITVGTDLAWENIYYSWVAASNGTVNVRLEVNPAANTQYGQTAFAMDDIELSQLGLPATDAVSITANICNSVVLTDEGCLGSERIVSHETDAVFSGWYDSNDDLVSTEDTLKVVLTANETYTAKASVAIGSENENGNFNQENAGHDIAGSQRGANDNQQLYPNNEYRFVTNANTPPTANNFVSLTDADGNGGSFLIYNTSSGGESKPIYTSLPIAVEDGKNYSVSFSVAYVNSLTYLGNVPELYPVELYINGTLEESFDLSVDNTWQNFSYSWTQSGDANVEIELRVEKYNDYGTTQHLAWGVDAVYLSELMEVVTETIDLEPCSPPAVDSAVVSCAENAAGEITIDLSDYELGMTDNGASNADGWYTSEADANAGTGAISPVTGVTVSDGDIFYLRTTDGGSENGVAELSFTINSLPTVSIDPIADACEGDGLIPLLASGIPTGGTGVFKGTGVTGSDFDPSTSVGSPFDIWYVYEDLNGCIDSASTTATVNPTPSIPIFVNDSLVYCVDETVSGDWATEAGITASGTITWYTSTSGASGTTTSPSIVTSSVVNEVAYITNTDNGCESDSIEVEYVINALPVLSLGFSPNDTVCVGTEVTLSDLNYTTGNSYVWSMSGSGTTEEEKVTPSTDLLFNVEVTDGNGCVSTADSVVRVDAAPDLVAPQGDMEVCATTATLPQVTPSVGTGVWSKLSTSTSGTIVDVTDPSTQVTGISPGTFIDAKWTVSNGVCPDVTDTVRVSSLTAINPVVNVNTPLSFNVCEDSDTTIIATGSSAGTYEYYVTGTPSSVLGTDSILDVTNITTVQQITVSFTATECVASGATNPVTKDIVITPMTAPTATITGFADGATYIFNELPGTVTGTAPGTGYDYSWEANPSTKGSANLLDYGFNSTMAYDDVVNLDFIVRNSGGECPSDTAHLEVIRKDITTAEALNDTICVTGGNNYTQTPQNLPNTSNNEQAEWLALVGSPTPSAGTGLDVTLTSKGEYGYVYRIYNPTVLDANSKPIESRDTVMIVVDAEVVGPVSAGVATDVCTDTVSLSGTGLSTGESGFWTGPSGLIFTEATSPTSQVTNFTDGVSHTLTWTKYSEYGVCPSVSGTVNLNKLSSVTAAAITGEDTLDVCLGDPVVLYSNAALASNNETGIWSSTDISLPSTSLNSTTLDITSEITSSAEGNYKLKWTISSTSCPTGSVDSVIVAVSGKPSQPSITGLPTMCEDSTATYTISSDPKATLGYVWSVKGQGSVVGTDTSGVVKFDRQLALTDAQKETVWVYAQSMNVCGGSEKDSMEVIIDLAPRQADYVAPSTSLSLQSDLTSICETTSGEVLEVTTPTGNNATKYRWMVEGTRLGNETTVPLSNQFDASDIPGFSDGSVVNMEVLFGNACGYYGAISDIAVTLVSKNDLEIDLSLANEIALDSVTSRELYAICSLDDSYSIKVEGQGVDLTGTDIVYDLIIDGELVLSDFPSNQLDGSLLLPSAKLPDGIVEVTAEISDPTKGCFTSPAIDSDQISLRDYSFEKFDIVGNKLICESDADLSLSLSIPQDTKDKKHNKIERAIWRFEDGSEMYGTTIEIGDPSKAGEVSLELINVNGCQTFNSEPEINPIEVVIDEKPVIVIEGKPVITVPVDVNNELPEYQLSSYVTNLNASEYTSNWGAESITSKLTESEILSWLSSTSVINPVIDPLDEDVARLIVTVVNGACETKDSIDIRATKPFMPPTAFTPNGDGLNDSWVVEGLTAYNKAVMKIYNRWGQLVFEKYGGYYDQFDGKNLPMATYYWTVEFNEPDKAPESGTVTILK